MLEEERLTFILVLASGSVAELVALISANEVRRAVLASHV